MFAFLRLKTPDRKDKNARVPKIGEIKAEGITSGISVLNSAITINKLDKKEKIDKSVVFIVISIDAI